ncbi:hypothetical protein B0H16DRAFT_1472824 [Mycena metata]|uniref:DUF6534 domain-containing protein n=1 Tax=Mycena metata TaxID=1033252 RepID=A0AAD7HMZ6_9AGAR|nr:hypothetical protein B0H16DRAFT_1472824 [Mycena metata]
MPPVAGINVALLAGVHVPVLSSRYYTWCGFYFFRSWFSKPSLCYSVIIDWSREPLPAVNGVCHRGLLLWHSCLVDEYGCCGSAYNSFARLNLFAPKTMLTFQRTSGIINRLIRYSVETGAVTSAGALTEFICVMREYSLIWVFSLLMLGKLYSNMLMTTLNARAPIFHSDLSGERSTVPSMGQVSNVKFSSRGTVNISRSTEVLEDGKTIVVDDPGQDIFGVLSGDVLYRLSLSLFGLYCMVLDGGVNKTSLRDKTSVCLQMITTECARGTNLEYFPRFKKGRSTMVDDQKLGFEGG